jgi:hypothetical protein
VPTPLLDELLFVHGVVVVVDLVGVHKVVYILGGEGKEVLEGGLDDAKPEEEE